jgi:hypothetical protein
MEVFTTLAQIASVEGRTTFCIVGASQAIALGPEDMLVNSPICENVTYKVAPVDAQNVKQFAAPALDYRQGKINRLVVRINTSGELSKRAGRIACALVPLTLERATLSKVTVTALSFRELSQLPGAITAAAGTPLSLAWSPTSQDWGMQMQEVGQFNNPADDTDPLGGYPVVMLHVGYQDMASSSPAPAGLYAPEEALINVDIQANISLREYGRSWIRPHPPRGVKSFGLEHPIQGTVAHYDHNAFYVNANGQIVASADVEEEAVSLFTSNSASGSRIITYNPSDVDARSSVSRFSELNI